MILAILSALGGVLASLLPELIKFFNRRQDNAHEIAMVQIQADLQKAGAASKLEEVRISSEAAESVALYNFANPKGGWAEQLNASVRPVLTYLLAAGYLYSKFLYDFVWDDTDMAIFAAVLGFWFCSRSISKAMNGKMPALPTSLTSLKK